MSKINLPDEKFQAVVADAKRLLDAYGRAIAADSAQEIYTAGELTLTRIAGAIEILYRGTVVLRYAPDTDSATHSFTAGDWIAALERAAQTVGDEASDSQTAAQ